MKIIKQPTTQKNTFKKITCFNDLVTGVEHCNGTNQHANFYKLIDSNTVSIQHFYRHGKNKAKTPFTMSKIAFDDWLNNL